MMQLYLKSQPHCRHSGCLLYRLQKVKELLLPTDYYGIYLNLYLPNKKLELQLLHHEVWYTQYEM
jgi:hypothetical protein